MTKERCFNLREEVPSGAWQAYLQTEPDLDQFTSASLPPKQDRTLCSRCQKIDFDAIFDICPRNLRSFGVPVADLGLLSKDDISAKCSLCSLFAIAWFRGHRRKPVGKQFHLRAFDSLAVLGYSHTVNHLRKPRNIVLAVSPSIPRTKLLSYKLNELVNEGVIVLTASEETATIGSGPEYSYKGRAIHPLSVEIALLRKQLDRCLQQHDECRGSAHSIPEGAIVFDCLDRTLVPMTENTKYLALSYVWGKITPSVTRRNPGQKLQKQSKTIEDTILLVQRLEMRYLWVDRLCISQDQSDDHKLQQIRGMADVFDGAVSVIVALGDDAEAGLPGLGSVARRGQPSSLTSRGLLVSTLPDLVGQLRDSKWSTRAWTYQEVFLAKRCLFFSPEQVYWSCRVAHWKETLINVYPDGQEFAYVSLWYQPILRPQLFNMRSKLETSGVKLSKDYMPSPVFLAADNQTHDGRSPFARHIEEYTSRDLSYPADALYAIKGLLSRVKELNYWGIPMGSGEKQDRAMRFANGLLWHAVTPKLQRTSSNSVARGRRATRRTGFPSWSWTSVQGTIRFFDPLRAAYLKNNQHDLDQVILGSKREHLERKPMKGTSSRFRCVAACADFNIEMPGVEAQDIEKIDFRTIQECGTAIQIFSYGSSCRIRLENGRMVIRFASFDNDFSHTDPLVGLTRKFPNDYAVKSGLYLDTKPDYAKFYTSCAFEGLDLTAIWLLSSVEGSWALIVYRGGEVWRRLGILKTHLHRGDLLSAVRPENRRMRMFRIG